MGKEKQVMYGFVVMFVLLLAGIVGNVSAAEAVQDQLQLEVRMLERINQLNLTNEQIGRILPILKNADAILDTTKAECDKLLAEEKSLLLQRKTTEADALEAQLRVVREKAKLEVQQVLLDLQVILTTEQKAMLRKHITGAGCLGLMQPVQQLQVRDQRMQIVVGKYAPPAQGNVKPKDKDNNYLDVKDRKEQVEDMASNRLPEEVLNILLEKQVSRLAELEKALEGTTGADKVALEERIADLKAKIAEMKESGNVVVIEELQKPGLGRGRMSYAPGQMARRMVGNGDVIVKGKPGMLQMRVGQYCGNSAGNSVMLKTLIKVLEEMIAAK